MTRIFMFRHSTRTGGTFTGSFEDGGIFPGFAGTDGRGPSLRELGRITLFEPLVLVELPELDLLLNMIPAIDDGNSSSIRGC